MFTTSKDGIALLKKFEGCTLVAVWDVDAYSIGYGHHSKSIKKGERITQAQAEKYLKEDLKKFESAVNKYNLSWMNQNRFDALVDFAYNCGVGNLASLLNKGKRSHDQIATSILKYNKAGGVVLKGLTKRRKAEAELFNKKIVAPEVKTIYYAKYTGKSEKIDEVLKDIKVPAKLIGSVEKRKALAVKNGIKDYSGTASQNIKIIELAKKGKLKKV